MPSESDIRASSFLRHSSFGFRLPSRSLARVIVSASVSPVVAAQISFQEEIHAIEIDYGMTDVQRVHPQNAIDSRFALPQGETR